MRYASSRVHARLDEREQHRLAEHEAERRVEVPQHALRMHTHVLDDLRELDELVVREHQRVGDDDPLDRRVRDVTLVPQRDVFERRLEVAAQHAGEAAQLLGLHRIALVRHRARTLLRALAEGFLDLAHLGALEMADLERERLRRSRRPTRTCTSLRRDDPGGGPASPGRAAGRASRRRSARPRDRCSSTSRPRRRACRLRSCDEPARGGRGRGAPASPTARAWRRRSSARRGCRAYDRRSACPGIRAHAWRSRPRAWLRRRGCGRAHVSSGARARCRPRRST